MRVMVVTGFYPGVRMGGAELQTAFLASGLAERGHQAVFVATRAGTDRHYQVGKVDVEEVAGLRVTGLKAFRTRLTALFEEYSPDVCYVRIFPETAELAAICRQYQVPIVSVTCGGMETKPLLLGHHPRETLAHLRSGEFWRHLSSFRGVANTDAHVCNTEEFAVMMRKHYPNRKIQTIYNATAIPPEEDTHLIPGKRVIWVNNFKRWKRPEWFIELAEQLPDYEFAMIGDLYTNRYGKSIRKRIELGPENLLYLGRLPVETVNEEIRKSDLLVYTSMPGREGFGNSFLQAWSRAVPTVSTYPLDGIPEREGIGRYAPTMESLVQTVDELMASVEKRMDMGRRAREYVCRRHQIDYMVDNYLRLFSGLQGNQYETTLAGNVVEAVGD